MIAYRITREELLDNDPEIVGRFLRYVELPENLLRCWNWRPAQGRATYGKFYVRLPERRYAMRGPNRVAFALNYGIAPEGRLICHRCLRHPYCVNPLHLVHGTHEDNMGDVAGDRPFIQAIPEEQLRHQIVRIGHLWEGWPLPRFQEQWQEYLAHGREG